MQVHNPGYDPHPFPTTPCPLLSPIPAQQSVHSTHFPPDCAIGMHSSSGSISKPSDTHQHAQRPRLSTTAQEVGTVQHTHPTGGGLLVWPAAAAAQLMTATPRLTAIGSPSLLPSPAHGCVEPGQAPPVMCAMACRCWCNMLSSHWPRLTPQPGHPSVFKPTCHTPTLSACLPA